MAFLLAFVAGLDLVAESSGPGRDVGISDVGARRGEAVAGEMVGSAAAVALDRRQSGGVQPPSRRRRTGGKARPGGGVLAVARKVSEAATVVALLVAALLDAQGGAFSLDVANTSARVALFRGDSPRVGAGGGLVSGLSAVVTEALVGGAVLRDVAKISTLETAFSRELVRHFFCLLPILTTMSRFFLPLPAIHFQHYLSGYGEERKR